VFDGIYRFVQKSLRDSYGKYTVFNIQITPYPWPCGVLNSWTINVTNLSRFIFFISYIVYLWCFCIDSIRTDNVFRSWRSSFFFLFREFWLVKIINVFIHHRKRNNICFWLFQKYHLKFACTLRVFSVVYIVKMRLDFWTFPLNFIIFHRNYWRSFIMDKA
jgi:hypothetical protein